MREFSVFTLRDPKKAATSMPATQTEPSASAPGSACRGSTPFTPKQGIFTPKDRRMAPSTHRGPRARRARAERACPSQLPLALPAARGPQGRCVGHCCCATPLVLVDTRASRAAFAAVPKRCSARRDTARWSGIRAATPLSLRESTRATSRTRHAIGRQRRSRRCRSRRRAAKCLLSCDTEAPVTERLLMRFMPLLRVGTQSL